MDKSCTTQSQCWASVVWAVSAPCRDCPKWPGIIPSTEIVVRSHQTWSHSCGAQHYPVSIAHAAISSLVFSNPIIANIMFVFLFIYNVDKQKKKQTNFLRVGSNKHVQNANVPALLATPPLQLPISRSLRSAKYNDITFLPTALASSPSHCPPHPPALCISSHIPPTSTAMHHRLIFLKKL